ncbi:MAG: hypothetical protein WKF90_09210 [Pyrinomonadaceae bacterium]
MLVLAVFLVVLMPPIMLYTKLRGNRELAYPFERWGAVDTDNLRDDFADGD